MSVGRDFFFVAYMNVAIGREWVASVIMFVTAGQVVTGLYTL